MTTFPYFDPPQQLVVRGPLGIRYDFNNGLRIQIPSTRGASKTYRVQIIDERSQNIVFSKDVQSGSVVETVKKYYVDWSFIVTDPKGNVFSSSIDLRDKDVLIAFPVDTLGDSIAWFSSIESFMAKYHCRVHVCMNDAVSKIFVKQYPEIDFVSLDDAKKMSPYATYFLGMFDNENYLPGDYRTMCLSEIASRILDCYSYRPEVDLSAPRIIAGPYVCISSHSTAQCKMWNNPSGWRNVNKWLLDNGFRVLCVDEYPEVGFGSVWNYIPTRAEDWTGPRPLQDRINIIKDACCFIGLPSGLSWLAWCCKVPVVMISGFSEPFSEFHCHRVMNRMSCHGCWNDQRFKFDRNDFLWCPRFEKLEDKFQCTKQITEQLVIDKLKEFLKK